MYKYNEIKVVHLEPTTKCNASCSQCLRSANGGEINPYLPITELSLDDIKKIFPKDFIRQLKRMYMCGNYGEPIVAQDCLKIYQYFRENNPYITLNMNTNGSARGEDWWKELARVLNGFGNVKFGIDGLADTHSIYRQGTDWHKIIKNAKAFISAGGNAIWEYIVFEHNEHQVEEAEKISQELRFSKFTIKKTWRFFSNKKNKGKKEHIGVGKDGEKKIFKKPKDEKYINPALKKEEKIKKKYGNMDAYINQVCIKCKVLEENNVYVSAEGLVLPCCWIANQLYIWYLPKDSSMVYKYIEKCGGMEKMSAKKNSLEDIVNGEFFQKFLPWSWKQKDIHNGRLDVCAKICGSEFDPFKSQYK